jgi:hypothetical protein
MYPLLFEFKFHGYVHRKNIPIYIQQDATSHSLFYLEIALHVLGGTSTHHQERIQLYLQHLVFVTPLLLPATIAAGSNLIVLRVYEHYTSALFSI